MAMPGRSRIHEWVGRSVVDREGAEIGVCSAVLTDDATGLPEWLYADADGSTVVVPLVDATEVGDRVQVTVSRGDAVTAPSPAGDPEHLSRSEEAALYQHYGIEFSTAASESVLPAEAAQSAPAGTPEEEAADGGGAERAGPGRWVAAAVAAVAGLGTLVAVLLRLRRARRARATTRAGTRGAAALAGLRSVAASAAPVAGSTGRLVVHGALAGATSAGRAAGAAARGAGTVAGSAGHLGREAVAASAPLLASTGRLVRSALITAAAGVLYAAEATARLAGAAAPVVAERGLDVARTGVDAAARVGSALEVVPETLTTTGSRLRKGWRKVMSRLSLGLGFGVGYVLGARAGRARFEQIKRAAGGLAERPEVQQALEKVRDAAPAPLRSSLDKLSSRSGGTPQGTTVDVGGSPTVVRTSPAVVTPVDPVAPGVVEPPDLPGDGASGSRSS
ncbi:PRC-barrel domain-containing protein [Geodermatophilus sp. SYSU D00815]